MSNATTQRDMLNDFRSNSEPKLATSQPTPRQPEIQLNPRMERAIQPFQQFGCWSRSVRIAYPGTTLRLVNWIAQKRRETQNYDELWERCLDANADCFQELQLVDLCKPSWFLPRGEVVFEVIKNPTNIPDNPPMGVMLRHDEANSVFGRNADYFFLRPTFASETMEVFTGDMAREHAAQDKSDILFMAKLYGPALRQLDLARRVVRTTTDALVETAEFLTAKSLQAARILGRTLTNGLERRRIRRAARSVPSALHPNRLRTLIVRSLALDLYREADIFRDALRTWQGASNPTSLLHAFQESGLAVDARSAEEFVRTSRSLGETLPSDRLRQIYREVQELRTWDPILCFEVHDQPGKLWLEAHWFEGQDGKVYVHY